MEAKIVLNLCLALGLITSSDSVLTGSNICKTGNAEPQCCYNFYEVDDKCVECPEGFYGNSCQSPCADTFYGKGCRLQCQCSDLQTCDSKKGCICPNNDPVCLGITTTPKVTTEIETTITTTTVTTRKKKIITPAPNGKNKSSVSPLPTRVTINETLEPEPKKNDSASLGAEFLGAETRASSPGNGSMDRHMLTVIAAVSASIATVLILALIIIVTRNRINRKRKSESDMEMHERSTASKVYAEINDDIVRPSCSRDDPGPSTSNGKSGGYEQLINVKKKGSNPKDSGRGSYALLDEVKKESKASSASRGSYQLLDDAMTAVKEYEDLSATSKDKDYERLQGEKSEVLKTDMTTVVEETTAKEVEDTTPDYTQVVRRTKSKGSKSADQTTERKIPSDYDKPPPLPAQRDGTKVAEQVTVPGNDDETQHNKMVLTVDDAPGRQLTNSVANLSYEIPPPPLSKTDSSSGKPDNQQSSNPSTDQNRKSESKNEEIGEMQSSAGDVAEDYDKPPNRSEEPKHKPFIVENYDCPPSKRNAETENYETLHREVHSEDYDIPSKKADENQNNYHTAPKQSQENKKTLKDSDIDRNIRKSIEIETEDYDIPLSQEVPVQMGKSNTCAADDGTLLRDNYDVPPVPNTKSVTRTVYDVPPTNNSQSGRMRLTSLEYDVPPTNNAHKERTVKSPVDYDVPPAKK